MNVKFVSLATIGLLLTGLSGTAQELETLPMPLTRGLTSDGEPQWVSLEFLEAYPAFLEEDSKQAQAIAKRIAGELEIAEDGDCTLEWTAGRPYPGFSTLPEALRGLDFVFIATIVGVSPGFTSTTPRTLYQYRPTELLRGDFSFDHTHYFWARHIDVEIQGKRICRKDFWKPPAPRVGDRVVILRKYPDGWLDSTEMPEDLGSLGAGELIVLSAEDGVLLPRGYREAHPEWHESNEREFLQWLRTLGGGS